MIYTMICIKNFLPVWRYLQFLCLLLHRHRCIHHLCILHGPGFCGPPCQPSLGLLDHRVSDCEHLSPLELLVSCHLLLLLLQVCGPRDLCLGYLYRVHVTQCHLPQSSLGLKLHRQISGCDERLPLLELLSFFFLSPATVTGFWLSPVCVGRTACARCMVHYVIFNFLWLLMLHQVFGCKVPLGRVCGTGFDLEQSYESFGYAVVLVINVSCIQFSQSSSRSSTQAYLSNTFLLRPWILSRRKHTIPNIRS